LDANNPNIARIVLKLYPDWLRYRGLIYTVPVMNAEQLGAYMATLPVIRPEDQRMILTATANEIPTDLGTLTDLVKHFPDTALNLMIQARTFENALGFWAVALSVLPVEKIDLKDLATQIKTLYKEASLNQAVGVFFNFAEKLRIEPKRLGQLLIEIGNEPVLKLIELQKVTDRKEATYKFNEAVLTDFLGIFAQKLKMAFEPVRGQYESVLNQSSKTPKAPWEERADKLIDALTKLNAYLEQNKADFAVSDALASVLPEDTISFINPTPRQKDLDTLKVLKEWRQKIVQVKK
jgi:hypothetical protein